MFEISRYLLQELSDLYITESSHSICRPFQRLFCKECQSLPDHEYSSPLEKNANVNLCLFCRLRQHYKVHTYVISMEFSVVNRRHPSRRTPLGPGAKKDGCFCSLMFDKLCYKQFCLLKLYILGGFKLSSSGSGRKYGD